MTDLALLKRLEAFGYYPLPRLHVGSPGYCGLLTVLPHEPAGHEPSMVQLTLRGHDGHVMLTHMHVDTPLLAPIVCPGQVNIHSQRGREATFFTFGGSVQLERLATETVFSLHSAAPVLELLPNPESAADELAVASEVLLARVEADLRLPLDRVLAALAAEEPEDVYLAVLQSLLVQEVEISPHHTSLNRLLQQEKKWYEQAGRWPHLPETVESLLRKRLAS